MAKFLAMASNYAQQATSSIKTPPQVSQPRMEAQSPADIKCSDCGHLVAMWELGTHVCKGSAQNSSEEEPASTYVKRSIPSQQTRRTSRELQRERPSPSKRNSRSAGLELDLSGGSRTSMHVPIIYVAHVQRSGNLPLPSTTSSRPTTPSSGSISAGRLSPYSSPSLSPVPHSQQQQRRPTTPLRETTFATSAPLSKSPSQDVTSPSGNKLPFFEKYAQVYGSHSASNSVSTAATSVGSSSYLNRSPKLGQLPMPNSSSDDSIASSQPSQSSSRHRGLSSPDTSPDLDSVDAFEYDSLDYLGTPLPSRASGLSSKAAAARPPSVQRLASERQPVALRKNTDASSKAVPLTRSSSEQFRPAVPTKEPASRLPSSRSEPLSLTASASDLPRKPSSKDLSRSISQLDNLLEDLDFSEVEDEEEVKKSIRDSQFSQGSSIDFYAANYGASCVDIDEPPPVPVVPLKGLALSKSPRMPQLDSGSLESQVAGSSRSRDVSKSPNLNSLRKSPQLRQGAASPASKRCQQCRKAAVKGDVDGVEREDGSYFCHPCYAGAFQLYRHTLLSTLR